MGKDLKTIRRPALTGAPGATQCERMRHDRCGLFPACLQIEPSRKRNGAYRGVRAADRAVEHGRFNLGVRRFAPRRQSPGSQREAERTDRAGSVGVETPESVADAGPWFGVTHKTQRKSFQCRRIDELCPNSAQATHIHRTRATLCLQPRTGLGLRGKQTALSV